LTLRKLPIRPGADGQAIYDNLKICGFEKIVREIAKEHNVIPIEMLGPSKRYSLSLARAHLSAILRWTRAMSYPELAELLGFAGPGALQAAEKRWGRELEKRYGYVGPWTQEYQEACHRRKTMETQNDRAKVA